MSDVFIMCMTTESYKERQSFILDTWFKDCEMMFYSDHEDENTYKVCEESDYLSGVIKQTKILKDIKENKVFYKNKNVADYKWIFFVDDDTFVNTEYLNSFCKTINEDSVYGYIYDLEDPIHWFGWENPIVVAGGPGILISTKLIKKIEDFSYPEGSRHGDVSATLIFRKHNFNLIHNTKFHNYQPDTYENEDRDVKNNISYHYMKKDDIYKAYLEIISA
jgi:hypothetical protein